ncbi:MAG: hypothetical protein COW84_10375 [Gammaproteobacteria bacterium CG22_combo_CG10-13_8_21_14_all_40_8]|nr:MAG: hypothetical protein COW84_10375 [Gammaproteobacteria bacterium CG22_combo_CG10-13_8_21_14_all_40_8]
MSQIIQFLEKIGSDSNFSDEQIWLKQLKNLDLPENLRQAFIDKNQYVIECFLGTDTNLMCVMIPAEEEQPTREEDDEKEEMVQRAS